MKQTVAELKELRKTLAQSPNSVDGEYIIRYENYFSSDSIWRILAYTDYAKVWVKTDNPRPMGVSWSKVTGVFSKEEHPELFL